MLKTARDHISTDELNLQELSWWERNAGTIAKVWEMQDDVSRVVRKHYLTRARKFFRNKNGKRVNILELGCGSGWVGQSMVDSQLNIIGLDFSSSQIELAKANSEEKKLSRFCRYYVADPNNDWLKEFDDDIDGVLIHSFLHHLDENEIEALFDKIKTTFKPGLKIFLYEPAFYLEGRRYPEGKKEKIVRRLYRGSQRAINILEKLYDRFDLLDVETIDDFTRLQNDAGQNGWYLSPKEVPFDVERFTTRLQKDFSVENRYWATIYLIGQVFKTNLVQNTALRLLICNTLFRAAAGVDRLLAKNETILRKDLVFPAYAFHVWECIYR